MMTRHAEVRAQQRCLSPFIIEMLLNFGSERPAYDGAEQISFDRKAWRRFERYAGPDAQRNSRLRKAYLIMKDNRIITDGWLR